eukprot:g14239.t1
MLTNLRNLPDEVVYSAEAYSTIKPLKHIPATLDKAHELSGPEFQTADYKVFHNVDGQIVPEEREHPGPGYQVCALFQSGKCNNFSAYPDRLRRGDPMGEWGSHGVCEECWQRRKALKQRGLPDMGNEGSPFRKKVESDLNQLIPVVPSFDREPIGSIVFFGDMFAPRIQEPRGQQVRLPRFNTIRYSQRLAQDKEGNWRRVRKEALPGGVLGTGEQQLHGGTSNPSNAGGVNSANFGSADDHFSFDSVKYVDVHDGSHFLLSAQDLAQSVFEHWQRDVSGKCAPGILTLVHNLDPDCVVISAGHLDLTEGCSAKDVFVATKILGEQALKVPRRNPGVQPERKIVYMAVPVTPTLKAFPDMLRRRHMVLERLNHLARMDPRVRVLQAFEGRQVSGGHFARPTSMLTEEEHAFAINSILRQLKIRDGECVKTRGVLEDDLVEGGPCLTPRYDEEARAAENAAFLEKMGVRFEGVDEVGAGGGGGEAGPAGEGDTSARGDVDKEDIKIIQELAGMK